MSGIIGEPPFEDRRDAGRKLAELLAGCRYANPVVFGLPRGGVPVAYEVAEFLDAPLDIIIARKLGAPGQPELGIGAVAEGGKQVLNTRVIAHLGVSERYIERVTRRETENIETTKLRFGKLRLENLRRETPRVGASLDGATAILVDDGLATGVTARAAVLAARAMEPEKVVLAAPVCAPRTARMLRREVDDLVCLEYPEDLGAIGYFYRDFSQTSDEEVVELLAARG